MKLKTIILGLSVILLIGFFLYLFFNYPSLAVEEESQLTLEDVLIVIRHFKSACFMQIFLQGILWGFFMHANSEERIAKNKKPIYLPSILILAIAFGILITIIWVSYFVGKSKGWANLHVITLGLNEPNWVREITSELSIFGIFLPFFFAHSIECSLIYIFACFLSFEIRKIIRK